MRFTDAQDTTGKEQFRRANLETVSYLTEKRGVNGVLQHSVNAVSKLVQVLLVSAIPLNLPGLASLPGKISVRSHPSHVHMQLAGEACCVCGCSSLATVSVAQP